MRSAIVVEYGRICGDGASRVPFGDVSGELDALFDRVVVDEAASDFGGLL